MIGDVMPIQAEEIPGLPYWSVKYSRWSGHFLETFGDRETEA